MTPPTDWPRHMKRMTRYGRVAVGQRVRWHRDTYAPTNDEPPARVGYVRHPHVEPVVDCVIEELRKTETGVAVVLRLDTGARQVQWGIDHYGHPWGGIGPHINVLAEPPEQRSLIRGGSARAAPAPRSSPARRSLPAAAKTITGDLFA